MKKTLHQEAVAGLCLELSLLVHAGVMMGDALALLSEGSEGEGEKALLAAMARRVDGGATLSEAMEESEAFPGYAVGLVAVGEQSGRTEEALGALAEYYERRSRMERQLRNTLLYPAVLLGLMLAVIGVLLVKVLPIFDEVYAALGGRLTGVAGGLLTVGRWLDAALPVLLVLLAVLVAGAAAYALLPGFRQKLRTLGGENRGAKGLSRTLASAKVAQAMSMALASGMGAAEAVELAGRLVEEDAPAAARRCGECKARLDAGERLGAAMGASGLLPPAHCRLLDTAERSGRVDGAMEHIARQLDQEGDEALERLAGRVEPALVLAASALVGVILLSVMLPLMHIMSAIG